MHILHCMFLPISSYYHVLSYIVIHSDILHVQVYTCTCTCTCMYQCFRNYNYYFYVQPTGESPSHVPTGIPGYRDGLHPQYNPVTHQYTPGTSRIQTTSSMPRPIGGTVPHSMGYPGMCIIV